MDPQRHATWATIGTGILAAGLAMTFGFPALAGRSGGDWWKHPVVIAGIALSLVGAVTMLTVVVDMLIPRSVPVVVEYVRHKVTNQADSSWRFEAYQEGGDIGLVWRGAVPQALCRISLGAAEPPITARLKGSGGQVTCAYPRDFPGAEPRTGSLEVSWEARKIDTGTPTLPPLHVLRGDQRPTPEETAAMKADEDQIIPCAALSVKMSGNAGRQPCLGTVTRGVTRRG